MQIDSHVSADNRCICIYMIGTSRATSLPKSKHIVTRRATRNEATFLNVVTVGGWKTLFSVVFSRIWCMTTFDITVMIHSFFLNLIFRDALLNGGFFFSSLKTAIDPRECTNKQ